MKKKGYILGALMAGAIFCSLNAAPVKAAIVSMPTHGSSYVRKGNTYKLYFKAPSKLTVNTKAKYTIVNTSNWKCIPYPNSKKNTKTFYLRAGHYALTTKSKKNTKIKNSYTRITKIRKSLETFSYKKQPGDIHHPNAVKFGKKINGLSDMYRTAKLNAGNYYQFTLDKDQKVTLNLNVMPVYQNARTNIFNNNMVEVGLNDRYVYDPYRLGSKGKLTNKKYSWNLTKGTYALNLAIARGRYNFKLTTEDTAAIPAQGKITNISSTNDGIKVDYDKIPNATGYGIYAIPVYSQTIRSNNPNTLWIEGSRFINRKLPNELSQVVPKNEIINGQTYKIAIRGMNTQDNKTFGPVSEVKKFTYYAPLTGDKTTPKTPKLVVSYYDDGGSDEPAININWSIDLEADSHEVQYRLKGTKKWTTFFSKNKDWDSVDDPTLATGEDFKKGQVYEIRVRALRSNLKSPWSEIKTIKVTLTPHR